MPGAATSSTPCIIVTRRLPPAVEARLSAAYIVRTSEDDRQLTGAELQAAMGTCDILLCTLTDRLTRDILNVPHRRTRMLANFGVGFEHIDVDVCRSLGLVVTNTPGALTDDTADLTMLLMLAAARRSTEGESELRSGQWTGWRPTHLLGSSVHGASLGILGLGRIGRAVARRAHFGFGMKVYGVASSSGRPAPRPDFVTELPTLSELLSTCDFLSLHTPSTPETRHLINAGALQLMRSSAFLINTARGDIVDSAALADALHKGTIAGAALDVYEGEPSITSALLEAPNLTLLPHLGSATVGARTAMGMMCADSIDAFVNGHEPPHRIA